MDITLPSIIKNTNIIPIMTLLGELSQLEKENIEICCSELRFIEPSGIAFLAAGLDNLLQQNKEVYFHFLSHSLASYLDRMDFFHLIPVQGVDLPNTRQRKNLQGTLCELKCLTEEHQAEAAIATFSEAITGRMNLSTTDDIAPRVERSIHYALSELVLNSLTHAKKDGRHNAKVWIAAQYYPQIKKVKAAVVDNGCGFLRSLNGNHAAVSQSPTHTTALSEALKERVSCNRKYINIGLSTNQGIGLTVTDRMIRQACGSIVISSGDAIYADFPYNPQKRHERITSHEAPWQGVGIAFDLPRDGLLKINIPDLLPATEWNTTSIDTGDVEINFT